MQCDPQLLWTFVHQQQEPAESEKRLFRHLENCQHCQATLEKLSGGTTWEAETSRWLSDWTSDQTLGDEDASHEEIGLPPISLAFLQPGRHPEMLGRIGRYDVEGVIGRGGMGIVLRGFDVELQRAVAIKVLAPEWAASPAARKRFAREAQAAASVAHDNVVPIYNVGAEATPPYLVMQFIPGVTLERTVFQQGPLTAEALIRIASQLAAGLSAAHSRGLVHRDVKPANVLVGENTDRVWLSDFGLARAADEASMTRTGVIAGTPRYMSPEQAKGQALDARSDWFSLGSLLYFAATGFAPFEAATTLAILQQIMQGKPKPIERLRPDLPPTFVHLIERLMHKKPERRPDSFDAVDQLLRQADKELDRGWMGRRTKRWLQRGALLAVIAAAIALISWQAAALQNSTSNKNGTSPALSEAKAAATEVTPKHTVNPWENPGELPQPVAGIDIESLLRTLDGVAGWNDASFQFEINSIDQQLKSLESNRP